MLYLRTGANGSCKSLFTLKDVRDKQVKEGRSVCVIVGDKDNPDRQYVKIKAAKMAEFGWTTCRFDDWWDQPDGTIFFADECHNYLPKRQTGAHVPQPVSRLAEHRARGFDFFLLTQHPSNIDTFVTKLIGAPGWHQHLKRVAGGSSVTSVIQWDAVNLQCEKAGAGRNAQVTMRPQPKEVYDWYDSAELHTGKVRIPRAAIFLAVAAVLIPVILGSAGYLLWSRTAGKAAPDAATQAGGVTTLPAGGSGGSGTYRDTSAPRTTREYIAAYEPRLNGLRHTAPAYDELTEPKRVPVPAACMQMGPRCACFTQDATPYTTTQEICVQIVKAGIWLEFEPDGERRSSERRAPPQVLTRDRDEPRQQGQQPALAVIGDPGHTQARPEAAMAVAAAQEQQRPRVPQTSPWSFRAGGR